MSSSVNQNDFLSVSRLTKSYQGDVVLSNVDLAQSEGESIVIIGSSGSGKSTLLRCLSGLEDIDSGTIMFRGERLDSGRKSRHKIRGDIGMLFQSFNLFPHLTVLENITLAPKVVKNLEKEERAETALALLDKVGLRDKAHHYPHELSGGQSQRVAIARALAMNPSLMLFDEPTSALDPELTQEVLDVMVDLVKEGMTVIVVTHEMSFARKAADTLVFMESGEVVERGPTEEVFDSPKHERTERFLSQISRY